MGGTTVALENGYMKESLVSSLSQRSYDIETNKKEIIGVNCYKETEKSPLLVDESIQKVDEKTAKDKTNSLKKYKKNRNQKVVDESLKNLKKALENNENIMPISIQCASNGITTGEWANTLREVLGEYRPPTGTSVSANIDDKSTEGVREKVGLVNKKLGRPLKILVGKPGLDGHSNGAEQIAVRARDVGMEVIYHGIRLTPQEIVSTVEQENVDLVGLSILSGSHLSIVPRIMELLGEKGFDATPLIVGGIIPDEDHAILKNLGVKATLCTHWSNGGAGTKELANDVVEICNKNESNFKLLYEDKTPLMKKIETIAKEIYYASEVVADTKIRDQLKDFEAKGYGNLPICIAKTQYSFSTDPSLKGAPSGHVLPIREVRLSSGAEFVVVICGAIMTMPGLPRVPAADSIKLNSKGNIEGLF